MKEDEKKKQEGTWHPRPRGWSLDPSRGRLGYISLFAFFRFFRLSRFWVAAEGRAGTSAVQFGSSGDAIPSAERVPGIPRSTVALDVLPREDAATFLHGLSLVLMRQRFSTQQNFAILRLFILTGVTGHYIICQGKLECRTSDLLTERGAQ